MAPDLAVGISVGEDPSRPRGDCTKHASNLGLPTPDGDRKEALLGGGYADLLAIESDGRPVVIEIKLAKNSEARRAVIAQVLSYAAALYEMSPEQLEVICAGYLATHDFGSIVAAVKAEDQAGSFDEEAFDSNLSSYLAEGRFRVVVVLDDAPPDLRMLARYLAVVGERLVVDIVSVQQFEVGNEVVIVPERIDLDRPIEAPSHTVKRSSTVHGQLIPGVEPFLEALSRLPAETRSRMEPLAVWATRLEADGLITLDTYIGKAQITLLPRLRDEHVGLVTIWASTSFSLSVWRSVFERRAPKALIALESKVDKVGQGSQIQPSDEVMTILQAAYEEATGVVVDS